MANEKEVKRKTTKKTESNGKEEKTVKETTKKSSKTTKKEPKKTVKKEPNEEQTINTKEEKIKEEQLLQPTNPEKIGPFASILILIFISLMACLVVYIVDLKKEKKPEENQTIASKEIQTFIEQYNNILENYYGDIDKNELIQNAIKGMLSSLDDYSEFIDDNSNNFTITLEGSYEGVGIVIANDQDGNIVVTDVYEDTPASKAGIQVGDYIIKFNEEELKDVTTKELVAKIKSQTSMQLTLLRNDKEITVDIKREKITLKSVNYSMLNQQIGYIQISIFASNTDTQFKEAITALEQQGMKDLIIDVRGNSGGHLDTVKNMLSIMMDNTHVIYQTQDKTDTIQVYSKGKETKTYPIVVLQNKNSASASEILSSALQEQLHAYVIGTNSFGKGTVQQLQTVSGLGQYKFTTKKWLTSNGTWIHGTGVKPDLELELSEEFYKNPTNENDNQLQKAIEYLTK